MKKLSLILALILTLSLTSCGEDSKKDKEEKKTVSITDILAKKDIDDDRDNVKYDDDDDNKDNEKRPEKASTPTVKKETSTVMAVDKAEKQDNENYKILKEETIQTPTFEIPSIGKFTIKSYKIVIPNYAKEERYIMYEGTYTNLSEYDTSMASFLSYINFYQNGIMISRIAFEEKDIYTPILTNANVDVVITYMLRDETTPTEIKWGEYSDNRQSYIINI